MGAVFGNVGRGRRAAWVWTFDDADAVVSFALRRGLDELFVHAPLDLDRHPGRGPLERLVGTARRHGIVVAALGGDDDWLDDPGAAIARWLAPVVRSKLFDRIHLDIEPTLAPGRPDPIVVARFVALMGELVEATPRQIPIEADVRFWYPEVPAGDRDLTSTLAAMVAGVTVLSYRNRTDGSDGSIAHSRPTAEIATRAGVPFRIGQETLDLGPEPHHRKQTFHGRPRRHLEAAMAALDAAFGGTAGYAGTAVHDWRGYEQLGGR